MSRKKMPNGQNNSHLFRFIERGKELRKLRGNQSIRDFAPKLGIPVRTYYRYESGERKLSDGHLKLAYILVSKSCFKNSDNTEEAPHVKDISISFTDHTVTILDLLRIILNDLNELRHRVFKLEQNSYSANYKKLSKKN